MKQLPNLNKIEEDFLANLCSKINSVPYKKTNSGNIILPLIFLSPEEHKMFQEIASKVTER